MKIEILIAIILGASIGLGATYGAVRLYGNSNNSNLSVKQNAKATPIPNTQKKELKNATSNTQTLKVEGNDSGQFVVISSNTTDTIAPVSNQKYEAEIALSPGRNLISVFSSNGKNISSKETFSNKKLPDGATYIEGVVTDITLDGFQVKTDEDLIEQVIFLKDIALFNIIKDEKEIQTTDLALGDRVITVGQRGEKQVITTSFVFIVSPDQATQVSLQSGKLTSYTKSQIVINSENGETKILYDKSSAFYGLKKDFSTRTRTKFIDKDLNTDVYITTTKTADNLMARSIFISE